MTGIFKMSVTDVKHFKRPESVLVVIYTRNCEVLLIRRCTPPLGWWQSVTGSLAWGESPRQAASREVFEETGLNVDAQLVETGVVNEFDIVPENRHLYGKDVTQNKEFVFFAQLPAALEVNLNSAEHDCAIWLPASEAAAKTQSYTNRAAILSLC